MPHSIELIDGNILTPFGIRDLLEAVRDYAGEELAQEKDGVEQWKAHVESLEKK